MFLVLCDVTGFIVVLSLDSQELRWTTGRKNSEAAVYLPYQDPAGMEATGAEHQMPHHAL